MKKTVRKRLSSIDFPSLSDLEKKTVIMLLNFDYALDYPEPLQPNMIQVGGLQITETKPLPEVKREAKKNNINSINLFLL